jgi:putative ABC transport system permease protein
MSWSRFLRRGRWDAERARELQAYVEIETDENIARGLRPDEARHAALRKLGNRTLIREEIFYMNTIGFVETLWRDLKYGVRLLRLNPGFAVVAILSLSLGVGANSAIFQLLDAVRLRTLPVSRPNELAEIRIAETPNGRTGRFLGRRPMLTNPLWEQIRDKQQGFSGAFAWGAAGFDLANGGELRLARGLWVSGDYFTTLRVSPDAGRLFVADDDRRGCAPRVVISHAFWQREYGGDRSAVGRSLSLDGHAFDIIGVTPASFFGVEVGRSFDVAVPICTEPIIRGAGTMLDKPDVWFLAAIGRLKPDWSIEKATAQLSTVSPGIFQQTLSPRYSPRDATSYLSFKLGAFAAGTGVSTLRRLYETPLWLLLAIAGVVLLIACANLANLMLARGTVRSREIAVRLAIGASRGRIVRQLVAESLVLSIIGAAIGAALAQVLSRSLLTFLSVGGNPVVLVLDADWRVFAFTGGLAVLTCVLFGLTPAIRATRTDPAASMKSGGRGTTDTRERFGLRRALVVAQVALSLVLVAGALLFVRTLRNLTTLDAGFRQDNLIVVNLDFRRAPIPEGERVMKYQEITGRLAALPGVQAGAQAFIVPVSGGGWNNNILIDGVRPKDYPNFNAVSPGYFRTMGTPMLAGRDFNEHDTPDGPRVVIVNETFAKKYFSGQNPVGRAFQIEEPPGDPRPFFEVVGLVKDTKYTDLREPFGAIGYFPASQQKPESSLQVLLRAQVPADTVTGEVTGAVNNVSPMISIQYQTLTEMVQQSLLRERLMATLSGFFGALAAVLATIGLYGVMSYMVARRRNEIGIRMALGADRRDVVRMVMREAGVLLIAGLCVGTALAVAAARTASTLLFGLGPGDPATLAIAAGALAAVAALASYLPAHRAARLEPTIALREE